MPRYEFEWYPEEAVAFNQFSTANELASALSEDKPEVAEAAAEAMHSIFHVNTSFWDWFESEEYFASRQKDIFFIGSQENFSADFESLKRKLKLPDIVKLPNSDMDSHKGMHSDTERTLTEKSIENLKKWYAKDYEFIELCQKLFVEK